MPIPASQIVQVNPRLISAGGRDLEFNALFLTSKDIIPMSQFVLSFSSADDVAGYFGGNSDEYRLASRYFRGYDDSFVKPSTLLFAPRISTSQAGFVRGGVVTDIDAIQDIESGNLSLTFGGKTVTVSSVDLRSAESLSNAAIILQSALRNADTSDAFKLCEVTYSSVFNAFTIKSGVYGTDSSVTVYPSGSVAEVMGLTQELGAVLSVGADAMTPAENMMAISNVTKNWVTFMSIEELGASDVVAFSEWASNQGVEYLHVYHDANIALTQDNPTGTIAQALKDANLSSTVGVYGTADYAALVCAIAASVDYDRTNGTITFKFKGQSGLGANVTNGSTAKRLEANGMNFIGNYASRNDSFVFFANGVMFGEYKWIDTYLNAVWLNNAIQVACMEGFTNVSRVPYTDEGYAIIRSWIQDPVNRALKNGTIEPGVTLSEAQKSQLQREAGRDISGELYTDGYVIQILDPAPAIRGQRESPEASLWYTYGGACHKLVLSSSVVE